MLHEDLEKTKEQGYPSVKSILSTGYAEKVDGIEDAKITAVDLGARSYGFIVNLPESSSAVEKDLFLKIQIPFHSSKSRELEEKEAKIQKKTFEFMEFAHNKFAVPKVLRSKEDNFVPHVAEDEEVPSDLKGYELVLMTKAKGKAVPFSKEGEMALEEFVRANPRKSTSNLFRDDANYTGQDIRRMASNIAEMHQVGAQFLEETDVPINPTHGMRSQDKVYSDLTGALGFDVTKISEDEIGPKVDELKKSINDQALKSLKKIPMDLSESESPQELASEAKANFLRIIPEKANENYKDKDGNDLPFSVGLEIAIRENNLTDPEQIKLGRQIQQIDETLSFAQGDKIFNTVKMARDISEIYEGVEKLPQTVLHNDTNASNFLLDQKSGKMTLIDYDTLGRGPRISDLMVHHTRNERTTKAAIAAYDEKILLTPEEKKFGPYAVACLTFDKLAETLGNFFQHDKMHESDHLSSLGWGIDAAYGNAKSWNEKEKVNLAQITDDARAEISSKIATLRGLDLAFGEDQITKKHDVIETKSGKIFGEENESWVKKIAEPRSENKSHVARLQERDRESKMSKDDNYL